MVVRRWYILVSERFSIVIGEVYEVVIERKRVCRFTFFFEYI